MESLGQYRKIRLGIVLLFLALMATEFLSGCMPSRLKKLKTWHQNGLYEQVVQSKIDCIDASPECFEIKLIRADSYYRLEKYDQAYVYVKDALERASAKVDPSDLVSAYTLYSELLFEKAKKTDQFVQKRHFVNQLLTNVEQALQVNAAFTSTPQGKETQKTLVQLKAEALLMKMDLVEPDSLDSFYQQLCQTADELETYFPDQGYRKYYCLRGEFKQLLPELKRAIITGETLAPEVKSRLMEIQNQARALQQMPLYRHGYAGAIDLFLDNLERFLNQLE